MLNKIATTLRWSLSIGNKFLKVVPRHTLLIVVATLVSQVSILLAFLLPLKVIMLLGSDGVPPYFPSFLTGYKHDVLIVGLSLIAIGFYVVYLAAEKIIAFGSLRGASFLLKKSHKMTLFENQEEVANRGFQRYSRSLASSVFLLLVAAALAWLYSELLVFLLIYIALTFLVIAMLYAREGAVKDSLDAAPGPFITTATNIGFLLAFAFMVVQFLIGNPPGLFVAIISIILVRQGFSRITGVINDLMGLYAQRFKLNALFFHGHVLVSEPKKHEENFWPLFRSPQREDWVLKVLQNVVSQPIENLSIHWLQLGIPDIATFRVRVFDSSENLNSEYLVKLFNANRSSLAKHEATLLAESSNLPALTLLSVDEVQGLHCHVMQWRSAKKISTKEALEAKSNISDLLMAIEPDKKIISRFTRSRPVLWQRIDSAMWERLLTVAEMVGSQHVDRVERLCKEQDVIKRRLSELPLMIVNPDQAPDVFLKIGKDQVVMTHWGRWFLEPIGANWPIQSSQLDKLSDALDEAKITRHTLRNVRVEDVRLSALMYALEKLCARQDFIASLRLIPRILQCLESSPEPTMSSS